MQRRTRAGIVLICALAVTGCVSDQYAERSRMRNPAADSSAMTNEDVIALAKARIGDDVIINMIERSGSRFRLSTPEVVALADSGVSDKVISAMLKSEASSDSMRATGHSLTYPWYGWYAGYPFWYPWDPWFYGGSWGYCFAPYAGWWYAPRYAYPYGRSPTVGGGTYRSQGRHR